MEINKFTVADYLLARLEQLHVDKVFQVPGDYVARFMEALERNPNIKAVGDINELGAAYAADGYARYKGMGAVSLQYGVGTFSALNAIAGAYVERNPVVVISASPSAENRKLIWSEDVLFHHATDDLQSGRKVFENVTVACELLEDSQTAPALIDKALIAAISERRPIYLEAWQNVWGEACEPPLDPLRPVAAPCDETSLQAAVEASVQLLRAAVCPVIMLGIEVARFGLEQQALTLIEASGLPFTTTLEAKTVLDESHPQFIGTYAGAASRPETRKFLQGADCILALGAIFTDDYLNLLQQDFGRIILVNTQQARTGYQYYQHLALPLFMARLTAALESVASLPFIENPAGLPARPTIFPASDRPLGYTTFLDTLGTFADQQALWKDSALILGESSSLYAASNLLGMPGYSFVADAIWGSLGHETGCALGVALASKRRPIVVAGDGGFMMMCQSLSTLVRNGINAVVFVMSNEVYAIEQAFVDIEAFQKGGVFAGFDTLPGWDYLALARAFGADGYRISTVMELQELLPELLGSQRTTLVQVVIPKHDLAPQIERLASSSDHDI